HLFVIIETINDKIVPASFEILGEARRLMDQFNKFYLSNEKVIAVILGDGIKDLAQELLFYGADAIIYVDNPNLKYFINQVYTKVIAQIVTNSNSIKEISPEYLSEYKKPRYMFFLADNIGRHLSATVLAELDSGLASDINKLVISDLEIKHQHKTNGKTIQYKKILEMYRPDFSGFLWTTILCLDNRNPEIEKEFHPQACSIIPGTFKPITKDITRSGKIIEFKPKFDAEDLKIKVLKQEIIKNPIQFENYKVIVSFGRGIKENPQENIKLVEKLAKYLDAEIGISLPISKRIFPLNEKYDSLYVTPNRVIGTSGRKVTPKIYIAVGISGAIQHLEGMKESDVIIAINPDAESPIKDVCDIFIKGRMEDVIPILLESLEKQLKHKKEEKEIQVNTYGKV
ncbi:MAG TPA: electron transfer flavoprotein subunit alpha/FixB family protein, partial [Nitrososphaeraceae archaeon]|nr:electron transfer flavoprotein subunit alpha/FixB family protein [Nitrososphaeraceae archaeon]